MNRLGALAMLFAAVTAQAADMSRVRGVTWYEWGPGYVESHANLRRALPEIQRAGFNTVWLVTPWVAMNPREGVYEEANIAALRETLAALRAARMHAFVGLNYLGKGWSPEGIDACNWIRRPQDYARFTAYATHLLRRLRGFEDVVYILVFTENSEPCGWEGQQHANDTAAALRATLGNFPKQLPRALRKRFLIGYHDYTLINLGWAKGASPVADAKAFDFFSMVAYDLEPRTDAVVRDEVLLRASRFPKRPLIVGEFGARACTPDKDATQARVNVAIARTALDAGLGFNLWAWRPAADVECARNLSGAGLAIHDLQGRPKPAAVALSTLLNSR